MSTVTNHHPDEGNPALATAIAPAVELWLTLDATARAPARARAAVRASAVGLDRVQRGLLELLVGELVTNSVVHGARGRPDAIRVLIVIDAHTRHVAVTDHGPGFERADPSCAPDDDRGFGLLMVDRAATRWGTTHGGRRVWFELPRHPPPGHTTTIAISPRRTRVADTPRRRRTRIPNRGARVAVSVALIAASAIGGLAAGELLGNAGTGRPATHQP